MVKSEKWQVQVPDDLEYVLNDEDIEQFDEYSDEIELMTFIEHILDIGFSRIYVERR